MKYQIEKNTVQETLIIPLYARKLAEGVRLNRIYTSMDKEKGD